MVFSCKERPVARLRISTQTWRVYDFVALSAAGRRATVSVHKQLRRMLCGNSVCQARSLVLPLQGLWSVSWSVRAPGPQQAGESTAHIPSVVLPPTRSPLALFPRVANHVSVSPTFRFPFLLPFLTPRLPPFPYCVFFLFSPRLFLPLPSSPPLKKDSHRGVPAGCPRGQSLLGLPQRAESPMF